MKIVFNASKYAKWYFAIISNAQSQQRQKGTGVYFERHHIIPKSLGGNNLLGNLVLLTAREHYVCHLLLPKMCVDSKHKSKMVYALMALTESGNRFNRKFKYRSRTYDKLKQSYIAHISNKNCYMYGVPKSEAIKRKISQTRIKQKTGKGKNNPMYGKRHTATARASMSEKKKEKFRDGTYHEQFVASNPKSRKVQCDKGKMFASLSEAGRYYNFVGLTAPRARIRNGMWKYV